MREADNPDDIVPNSGPGKRKTVPTAKAVQDDSTTATIQPTPPDASPHLQKKRKKNKKDTPLDRKPDTFTLS